MGTTSPFRPRPPTRPLTVGSNRRRVVRTNLIVPKQAAAPFDGRTQAAYAKYLDAQNQDRDLLEQEKLSTERYLKRHHSIWMYFPHVELLFLLFAYQGASAAEARMIYSGCFPLVVLGLCALVRKGTRGRKKWGGWGWGGAFSVVVLFGRFRSTKKYRRHV